MKYKKKKLVNQKIGKNVQILEKVAKTVAKSESANQFEIQNIYKKHICNLKISTMNRVLKLLL